MEKKNKKLIIIVGALLLVIGVSFSYFLASILVEGNGATSSVTTASINGSTINIDGTLEFEDLNVLPGHQSLSAIKLTAVGENELVPYNLIWKGINGLNTELKYTVYKTNELQSSTSISCLNKSATISGVRALFEECELINGEGLGSPIASGTISTSTTETKVTLVITFTQGKAIGLCHLLVEPKILLLCSMCIRMAIYSLVERVCLAR